MSVPLENVGYLCYLKWRTDWNRTIPAAGMNLAYFAKLYFDSELKMPWDAGLLVFR